MFNLRSEVCYWATFPRDLVPSCYKIMLPVYLGSFASLEVILILLSNGMTHAFSWYSTSRPITILPVFHSTFLWPAVISSLPLLPLLSLSPAAHLLLSHLQEEDPLLLLAEGLQHLGVHPHVLKDFCQHLASFPPGCQRQLSAPLPLSPMGRVSAVGYERSFFLLQSQVPFSLKDVGSGAV